MSFKNVCIIENIYFVIYISKNLYNKKNLFMYITVANFVRYYLYKNVYICIQT